MTEIKKRKTGLRYNKTDREYQEYGVLYSMWIKTEYKTPHLFRRHILIPLGYRADKHYVGLITRFKNDFERENKSL